MMPKQEVFIAQVVDWYIDQSSIVLRIALIVAAMLAQAWCTAVGGAAVICGGPLLA